MNFAFILRVLLIAAAFVIPFLEPERWGGGFGAQLGDFIFIGIVFIGSAVFSLFGDCMTVVLDQRREMPRPSLRAPIFSGRSPLQFFWFAGILSISVGLGVIVRHLAHTVSFEGVLLIAVGLGLVSGSALTLKIFSGRFLKIKK